MPTTFPEFIDDEQQLEELLSEPSERVLQTMQQLEGDLIILGVGGKMGPTLARMAKRADEQLGLTRNIIGVSRFSSPTAKEKLEAHGIEPITADLMDAEQIAKLPSVPNVIAMTGMKFGTTGQESLTWAMNTHLPALICQKYRDSRIVAFSTGNVYGLTPVKFGGSLETDELQPVGEYAWSRLGGERIFEHFSKTLNIPMIQLRLNYAHELRYGVLVDIAQKVYNEEVVNVSMGHLNALWQSDANAMTLCAFEHVSVPASIMNLAGPETISVRRAASVFGELFKKTVHIEGTEAEDAFLSNGQLAIERYGYPRVSPRQMMRWIASWVQKQRPLLGKPTRFESRDGNY